MKVTQANLLNNISNVNVKKSDNNFEQFLNKNIDTKTNTFSSDQNFNNQSLGSDVKNSNNNSLKNNVITTNVNNSNNSLQNFENIENDIVETNVIVSIIDKFLSNDSENVDDLLNVFNIDLDSILSKLEEKLKKPSDEILELLNSMNITVFDILNLNKFKEFYININDINESDLLLDENLFNNYKNIFSEVEEVILNNVNLKEFNNQEIKLDVKSDIKSNLNNNFSKQEVLNTFFKNIDDNIEIQDVDGEYIVRQIVREIKFENNIENIKLEMTLKPESLGKVVVSIENRAGEYIANLKVDNSLAKDALLNNLQILKEQLVEKGIQVKEVEVTLSNFEFNNDFAGQNNEQYKQNKQSGVYSFDIEEENNDDDILTGLVNYRA